MKKKKYFIMALLMFFILAFNKPIQSNAFCFDWAAYLSPSYCATPVCHTGNRTSFTDQRYERVCSDGILGFRTEYKIVKVDNGCCPYN